jgi:glycosyltransferase involved in cell wall biosynthesis
MKETKVSVIMGVYNGERYLHEAIESILQQTFTDFEFIIINDGSNDTASSILQSYKDPRIVLINNDRNIGLTKSLNRGLEICRGVYIARMDVDDISLPERLERQVRYLDANPEIGLLASSFVYIDEAGNEKMLSNPPTNKAQLKEAMLKENQFCHGVVMFRRSCIEKVGSYRPEFRYTQDYDQWLRILEFYEIASLPEVLYKYRVTVKNISVAKLTVQNTYHSIARECSYRRRSGLPEDLSKAEELAKEEVGRPSWSNRLLEKKNIADYYFLWGRSFLSRDEIKKARKDLLHSIKIFPFNYRAWLFLGASYSGYNTMRSFKKSITSRR